MPTQETYTVEAYLRKIFYECNQALELAFKEGFLVKVDLEQPSVQGWPIAVPTLTIEVWKKII